jgi:hypothetical protein
LIDLPLIYLDESFDPQRLLGHEKQFNGIQFSSDPKKHVMMKLEDDGNGMNGKRYSGTVENDACGTDDALLKWRSGRE